MTVTSRRPKIIKLHGDYLFDDIKSTMRETESLEDNIKKKLVEFGREFGLVVVGYSGADRSVMDVLNYLLRSDEYFKHGIYWCIRKGDEPCDELLKLLWRERVYFVEVDGFDEIMASLHNDLLGDSLPIDTSLFTEKPKATINRFCDNNHLIKSLSPVISRDLDKLRKINEREELLKIFRGLKRGEAEDGNDVLDDKEFIATMEIRRLVNSADFDLARARIDKELTSSPSKRLKEDLLDLRVMVEDLSGNAAAAINSLDDMINSDPKEQSLYLRKSLFIHRHEEKLAVIACAEEIDPFDEDVTSAKIDCLLEGYRTGTAENHSSIISQIKNLIDECLGRDPGHRNPVWWSALEYYRSIDLPKSKIKESLDELIEKLSNVNPNSLIYLKFLLLRWSLSKEDQSTSQAEQVVSKIAKVKSNKPVSEREKYEWLEMDALKKFNRNSDLSRKISEIDVNSDLNNRPEFLIRKADFLLAEGGNLSGAIEAARGAVRSKRRTSDLIRLSTFLRYAKDSSSIAELFEKKGYVLNSYEKSRLKQDELVAKNDIEGYLTCIRSLYAQKSSSVGNTTEESHTLILLKRYDEAARVAKSMLEKVNWDKEHASLIVNYELAESRAGRSWNKRRISEVAESTKSELERAGCMYFLGNHEKAKAIMLAECRSDKENLFILSSWAIFDDPAGVKFISTLRSDLRM
ncbi:SIR2 family protein [Xanthomonas arboricola]|uniref:SIR2 family protein n=1 Tax=Xanthomonas arboricola TaxID=56448 RepID=UPI0011B05288